MAYSFTYNQAAAKVVNAYTTIIKNFITDTSTLAVNAADSPNVYNSYIAPAPYNFDVARRYYMAVSRPRVCYTEAEILAGLNAYLTSCGFFVAFPGGDNADIEGIMELLSLVSRFLLTRTRFWFDYFATAGTATALFYEGEYAIDSAALFNNDAKLSEASFAMITNPFSVTANPTIIGVPAVRTRRTTSFNSCSCSSSGFLMYMAMNV
jgi:hypothetical protein